MKKKVVLYGVLLVIGYIGSHVYQAHQHNKSERLIALQEHERGTGIRLAHSLLIDFEGFSNKCYKDNKGRLAVGHGFTGKKPKHCKIAEDVSLMRLWDEAIQRSDFIDEHVTVYVNSNRRASLITFIFNIGRQGFLDSKVLVAINNGDWEQARLEMLEWSVKNPKYKRGVAKRRQIEADLLI